MRVTIFLALVLLAAIAPATSQKPRWRGQAINRQQRNQKPAEQVQLDSEEEVEQPVQARPQRIKGKQQNAQSRQQWDLAAAQEQLASMGSGQSFSSAMGTTGFQSESSEGAQERYEQELEAAEEQAEALRERQEQERETAQEMQDQEGEAAQEMQEQELEAEQERREQEAEALQEAQENEAENAQEMQEQEESEGQESEASEAESEVEESEVEESEPPEGAEEGEGGEGAEGGEGEAGTNEGGGGSVGSSFTMQGSGFSSVGTGNAQSAGTGNAQSAFAGPEGESFFDPNGGFGGSGGSAGAGGSAGTGSSALDGGQGALGGSAYAGNQGTNQGNFQGSNGAAISGGNGTTGAGAGASVGTSGASGGASGPSGGANGSSVGMNGAGGQANAATGGKNSSTGATNGKPSGTGETSGAAQGGSQQSSIGGGFGPSVGDSFYDTANVGAENEPNIAFAPAPLADNTTTKKPLTPEQTAAVDAEYMDKHLCGGFLGANGISGMKDLAVIALDYAGKEQALEPCNIPRYGRTTRRQPVNIAFRSAFESRGQDAASAVLHDLPGMIKRYQQTPSKVHIFSWFTPSEQALRSLLAKKQRGGLSSSDVALGYVEESKLARFSALIGDTTFTNLLAELERAGISVQRLCGSCQQIANMTKWQRKRQGLVNGVGVFDQQSGQCGPVAEVTATEQLALGQPQCQNFQESMGSCLFGKLTQACPWLRNAQAASEQPLSAIMETWAADCGKSMACWRGKGSYLSLLARTAGSCRVSPYGVSGAIAQCVSTGMNAPLDPPPSEPAL